MNLNKFILNQVFFFFPFLLLAQQEILYVDSTSALGLSFPVSDLSFLQTDGSSCVDIPYGEVYFYYTDICVAPDNTRYGFYRTNSYDPPAPIGIYELLNPSQPFSIGGQSLEEVFQVDTLVQGLVCDSTGTIYAAGKGLSILTPPGSETYFGDFPENLHCQGDIILYNGLLYMVAAGNKLVLVDINNPALSQEIWQFPPDILPIHGLTAFKIDCDSTIVYAAGKGEGYSVLYEIDFENQVLSEVCNIPGKTILGMASYSEASIRPCEITVDLDSDDSSGGTDNDFIAEESCLSPIPIVEDDVSIITQTNRLDSITISLSGIIDEGMEYLTAPFTTLNDLILTGSGTDKIKITDVEASEEMMIVLEFALQSILYHNDLPIPTNGTREIIVKAYSTSYESEAARSWVTLDNQHLELNYILNEPDCYGGNTGSINVNPSGGEEPYNISWNTGTSEELLTDLTQGSYNLTVTDGSGCQRVDTVELEEPDSLFVIINNSGIDNICDNSGALETIISGGTPPYSYIWNNGSTAVSINQLIAGEYTVTVADINECEASASYTLMNDTIFVNQQESLCQGDFFEFNNEIFETDTNFCVSFLSTTQCDSIHCVDLIFGDTSYVGLTSQICEGEIYDFDGSILEQDTFVCKIYSNVNGCDSTVCLELTVLETTHFIYDYICQGETYNFNEALLGEQGIYSDTVIASTGCDSIIILELQVNPEPVLDYEIEGSFCVSDEVSVAFNPENDYLWETGEVGNVRIFTEPGIYTGTAVNMYDCEANVEFTLENSPITNISYNIEPVFCYGDMTGKITIDSIEGGSAPYQYSINNQDFSQLGIFENLGAGNYVLTVRDIEGCELNVSITLDQPENYFLSLNEDTIINLGDSILLNAVTDITDPVINWSPVEYLQCSSCLVTYATPLNSIEYELTVIDSAGCILNEKIEITVNDEVNFFVPSAFSPNGDNINDIFTVYTGNTVKIILEFRIYDRWGNLVFEGLNMPPNEESTGWDGTFKGVPLNSGIYTYYVSILGVNDKVKPIKGAVNLMR